MMTTRKSLITSVLILTGVITFAQESPAPQMLLIHEDNVIVGKDAEYQQAGKGFVDLLKASNFTGFNISGFRLDDYTYWYVMPIQHMADLDHSPFEELSQKVGKEKFESTMAAFDGNYDTHMDYIAIFNPELSYKPEQLEAEGNDYRRWMYLYYNPVNQDKVVALAKEWKKLYEENDIPQGYTIYSNGLGHKGPVLVVHSWASSPVELDRAMQARNEKLGEKGNELWKRTEKLTYKIENKTGWYLPELSYHP